MKDYTDRLVTPPKWVTSPIWGPPPACKQHLRVKSQTLILLACGLSFQYEIRKITRHQLSKICVQWKISPGRLLNVA